MSTLKDLEKRVAELESKVEKLEGKHVDIKKKSSKKSKKEKKEKKESSSSEKKSKKKRKPNKFLIAMNDARKKSKINSNIMATCIKERLTINLV